MRRAKERPGGVAAPHRPAMVIMDTADHSTMHRRREAVAARFRRCGWTVEAIPSGWRCTRPAAGGASC
jgi:hypothetical protein